MCKKCDFAEFIGVDGMPEGAMREVRARIRCSGTFHTIGIMDGRAFSVHHDRDEVEAARVAGAIGGVETDIPCLRMLDSIDRCLRSRLPPDDDMPRAISDYIIRRRKRAVAHLRHRQRHLEKRARRVFRLAETAGKEDLGHLGDILESVVDEIRFGFGGEATPFLMSAVHDAEAWVARRRGVLTQREADTV